MSNNRKEEIILTTFELAAQKGLAIDHASDRIKALQRNTGGSQHSP